MCMKPSLAYCDDIGVSLFQKCGTRTRTKLVDIVKVAVSVGIYMYVVLIGMNVYTGCDTISALAGKGKASALKLLTRNPGHIPTVGSNVESLQRINGQTRGIQVVSLFIHGHLSILISATCSFFLLYWLSLRSIKLCQHLLDNYNSIQLLFRGDSNFALFYTILQYLV